MRTLLIALALTASFGSAASAYVDDPIRWEWRCQGTVHGMEVSPDGRPTTYRPEPPSGFQFRIRQRGPGDVLVNTGQLPTFFIDIEGPHIFYSKRGEAQTLDGRGDNRGYQFSLHHAAEKNDLQEVDATLNEPLLALKLERDDQGWRFIMSRPDVTTLRRARELRARVPNMQWEPRADIFFATGECLMTFTPKEPRKAG